MITMDFNIIENDLLKTISQKYNIPHEELVKELHAISQTTTKKSKFTCDHLFFSRDNELSFYWAGFIAADGCVFNKESSKQLIISLAIKDKFHLENFKNQINFDGNITGSITKHSLTNEKWNDSIKRTIRITSFQIFEDLKRFNVVNNKTKTYTFPEWLQTHPLVNHYMRGYNDGDGSFYKGRNRIGFELRGTKEFLETYRIVLEKEGNLNSKVNVTTPDSTSKLKYSGKKILPKIVDFLYKDATIYFQRKYDIANLSYKLLDKSIKLKDL